MKKIFGFTLMETSIALLIVSILIAVCFPVLSNRENKEKSYSYYLAYRTVESIATNLLIKDSTYVSKKDPFDFLSPGAYASLTDSEFESSRCSNALGYYNMSWNDSKKECVCDSGKVQSINNIKVCCAQSTSALRYFAKSNGDCVGCPAGKDFNETGGYCCPEKSYYNGSTCTCMAGYTASGSGSGLSCNLSSSASNVDDYCPKGYKYSASVNSGKGGCVLNIILSPEDFCKNMADRMNIKESTCNNFSNCGNGKCYKNAFQAAVGTDGIYLSKAVKTGAFKNLTPNIVFANGLKLWITQQKSASIPGLSMAPSDIDADEERNSCYVDSSKSSATACGANWCETDGKCYKVSDNTLEKLSSASSCCSSPEINWSKIITGEGLSAYDDNGADKNIVFAKSGFTVFVDIDGDKGSGTLWEDVVPFYICNDGLVYPGYALGDGKSPDGISLNMYNAGDNPSLLAADVYYYETSSKNKPVTAFSNISFARAACLAGKVSVYTPYCLNLSFDYKNMTSFKTRTAPTTDDEREEFARDVIAKFKSGNPCTSRNCFISVKKKTGLF